MPEESGKQKIEDIFAGLEVDTDKKAPTLESEAPILKMEKASEKKAESLTKTPERLAPKKKVVEREPKKPAKKAKAPAKAIQLVKPPLYNKVEKVLEEDLAEVFSKMPKDKQKEFQKKGEETTRKISQLLQATKLKVGDIFKLIIGWLKFIPGVNKYYLEQEAKLKTDKLLLIREKELRK